MNSLQRVLISLSHKEPDRVPFFLLLNLHGAKEMGIAPKEYFERPELVAEAQARLRRKYGHDCLYGFFYAPIEVESMGGEVIFGDDRDPNAGEPIIRSLRDIDALELPEPKTNPALKRALEAISLMKAQAKDEVPIVGVAMSPFSLPVMQMGFDAYLDLLNGDQNAFENLMAFNVEFCVRWANAQLEAGATVICYFDPVSSPTIIPRDTYLRTGKPIAKRTLGRIRGPTATHLASGAALSIIDDVAETSTAVIGVSAFEDLKALKAACGHKLTIIGNLNGIEMRRWTAADAEREVRKSISEAGQGGGFILSDNHGEIPVQVPDSVLSSISEAVERWGRYPLDLRGSNAR